MFRSFMKLSVEEILPSMNESVESKSSISLLGYGIGHGAITPDLEKLRPVQEFPLPENAQPFRE